ncbi:MAG: RNA 3'-terminal phosphate cyclase [Planctomycetales bacterium]|nr:RNA 3'-terminal phosphate cyclase [Planctomycetales bacterium]
MIEIDGSAGEGGGQIVRSSLALSAVTGTPVRIKRIRAKRKRPGLLRQHLTAVQAISRVCKATVQGDVLGSNELEFHPQAIQSGYFEFRIGSAGSATLVAQTVLPALWLADGPSQLIVSGGTHNPLAPPFEYLQHVFAPLVNRLGPTMQCSLQSYGFYPAGGGQLTVGIEPATTWRSIHLVDVVEECVPTVTAIVSDLPRSIAERECRTILRKTGWPEEAFRVVEVKRSQGPGNVVMIQLDSPQLNELFIAFGEVGKKAEHVARNALKQARDYQADRQPVGPHLADQLMLPIALAAMRGATSSFRTGRLTPHSLTHLEIIQRFLKVDVAVRDEAEESVLVSFAPET